MAQCLVVVQHPDNCSSTYSKVQFPKNDFALSQISPLLCSTIIRFGAGTTAYRRARQTRLGPALSALTLQVIDPHEQSQNVLANIGISSSIVNDDLPAARVFDNVDIDDYRHADADTKTAQEVRHIHKNPGAD